MKLNWKQWIGCSTRKRHYASPEESTQIKFTVLVLFSEQSIARHCALTIPVFLKSHRSKSFSRRLHGFYQYGMGGINHQYSFELATVLLLKTPPLSVNSSLSVLIQILSLQRLMCPFSVFLHCLVNPLPLPYFCFFQLRGFVARLLILTLRLKFLRRPMPPKPFASPRES